MCTTLFQIESEKSHIKLLGNIIHSIIVQPGTIGEYIVKCHFPSFQSKSSGYDNHLCEQAFVGVCILKNLSQFVKMLCKVLSPSVASKDSKWDNSRTQFMRQVKFWISRMKTNLGYKQLKHIQILRNI